MVHYKSQLCVNADDVQVKKKKVRYANNKEVIETTTVVITKFRGSIYVNRKLFTNDHFCW